jgi:hypothetical protein
VRNWGSCSRCGRCSTLDIRASAADAGRQDVLRALRAGHDGAPAAAAEAPLDLIDLLCARSPAVLVVDDLHWADAGTVSVCHRLARTCAQRPLLLIGAMRPLPRRHDLKGQNRKSVGQWAGGSTRRSRCARGVGPRRE